MLSTHYFLKLGDVISCSAVSAWVIYHAQAQLLHEWMCGCADCPGFVQKHEAFGGDKNVVHFQQMLQKHGSMADDKTSVAWWLTKQAPQVSNTPVAQTA